VAARAKTVTPLVLRVDRGVAAVFRVLLNQEVPVLLARGMRVVLTGPQGRITVAAAAAELALRVSVDKAPKAVMAELVCSLVFLARRPTTVVVAVLLTLDQEETTVPVD